MAAASPNKLRTRAHVIAMLFGTAFGSASSPALSMLSIGEMQSALMRHDKVVLLLHAKGCPQADELDSLLNIVSREMPQLVFGRVDVSSIFESRGGAWKADFAEGISIGAPTIKVFVRALPGRRAGQHNDTFEGPHTLDAIRRWAQTLADRDIPDVKEEV